MQYSIQLMLSLIIRIGIQGCVGVFSCDQAALWMVFSVRPSHIFDYVAISVFWEYIYLLLALLAVLSSMSTTGIEKSFFLVALDLS